MSAHGWILTIALVGISTALADISPNITSLALCVFGAAIGALLIAWIIGEVKSDDVKGGGREH